MGRPLANKSAKVPSPYLAAAHGRHRPSNVFAETTGESEGLSGGSLVVRSLEKGWGIRPAGFGQARLGEPCAGLGARRHPGASAHSNFSSAYAPNSYVTRCFTPWHSTMSPGWTSCGRITTSSPTAQLAFLTSVTDQVPSFSPTRSDGPAQLGQSKIPQLVIPAGISISRPHSLQWAWGIGALPRHAPHRPQP